MHVNVQNTDFLCLKWPYCRNFNGKLTPWLNFCQPKPKMRIIEAYRVVWCMKREIWPARLGCSRMAEVKYLYSKWKALTFVISGRRNPSPEGPAVNKFWQAKWFCDVHQLQQICFWAITGFSFIVSPKIGLPNWKLASPTYMHTLIVHQQPNVWIINIKRYILGSI